MDLNYMIADEWLEMFESLSNSGRTEFLQESFLQEVPPDFIEEISFLELIINHYEYLKKEKQYDKIIELQNLINEHNAELFGESKFYVDEYIAGIYIFKNEDEEERIKESMSSSLEKPVESCVRVAETMDLNYMIADEWLEMFESLPNSGRTEFLQESFLQEVPPDFIEEISFLELIINHYEYLKTEKQYDKIVELQNLINEHNAELFGESKFYVDEYIAEIHLFRNEEELVKESMSSFLEEPLESMEELIPLVNKLVYYDHSEFVQLICEKVYNKIKNEKELMAGSGKKIAKIIKMFLLQALCRQVCEAKQAIDKNTYITVYLDKMREYGIGKDEVNVFIQTILGIEGNLNNLNNAEGKSSSYGSDSDDALNNGSDNNRDNNSNESGEKEDQEFFNTLLSLFCIDVLYNKNINFATASDIWTGAWECFSLENYSDGISGEVDNSFKLNKEGFRDFITDGLSLLSNLKTYTFAVVWGLPYVYDFLQKYRLINIKDYNEALECINNVKMQLIEGFNDDLWEYNFVHTWQRPDSISAKKHLKEKELFTKVFVEQVDIEEFLSKQYSPEENVSDKIFLLDAKQMKEWRRKKAHTIRNNGPKVGRNDPCPCGSGKKFKKCCGK